MKQRILLSRLPSLTLIIFVLIGVPLTPVNSPIKVSAHNLAIDGDISDFIEHPALAVSGANGSRNDVTPRPPQQEDFDGDGTITELYAEEQDGSLFLAIRGDLFGEPDADANAVIILFDIDPGTGTGAKDLDDGADVGDDGTPSDLNDLSDSSEPEARRPRSVISDAGVNLSSELIGQGIGWDMALSLTGVLGNGSMIGGLYSWGSAGLPGAPTAFATLRARMAYDFAVRPFGAGRGKPGTVIGGMDGFEVEVPLAQLNLSPGNHQIRLVAIVTSDTGRPSPNQLPESSDMSKHRGTTVLDKVAHLTITVL